MPRRATSTQVRREPGTSRRRGVGAQVRVAKLDAVGRRFRECGFERHDGVGFGRRFGWVIAEVGTGRDVRLVRRANRRGALDFVEVVVAVGQAQAAERELGVCFEESLVTGLTERQPTSRGRAAASRSPSRPQAVVRRADRATSGAIGVVPALSIALVSMHAGSTSLISAGRCGGGVGEFRGGFEDLSKLVALRSASSLKPPQARGRRHRLTLGPAAVANW